MKCKSVTFRIFCNWPFQSILKHQFCKKFFFFVLKRRMRNLLYVVFVVAHVESGDFAMFRSQRLKEPRWWLNSYVIRLLHRANQVFEIVFRISKLTSVILKNSLTFLSPTLSGYLNFSASLQYFPTRLAQSEMTTFLLGFEGCVPS